MSLYVIDTETTGNDPAEVIELAWLPANVRSLLPEGETRWQRFKPQNPSSFGALAVHHILDDELIASPPSSKAKLPEDTKYIIGHNVDYDWRALGCPEVKRICTLAIARSLYPDKDHTLGALVYMLAQSQMSARNMLQEAHDAAVDVELCFFVLRRMAEQKQLHWKTEEELWHFSEKCRIPTIMPFGKHKGLHISKLPKDYVRWCRQQADMDPYFILALKEYF